MWKKKQKSYIVDKYGFKNTQKFTKKKRQTRGVYVTLVQLLWWQWWRISTEKERDGRDVEKERESWTDQSNQSISWVTTRPPPVSLSLSAPTRLCPCFCPSLYQSPAMTTSPCLSFFLCRFTWRHKCRSIQIGTGTGWREEGTPLFQNETQIKQQSDL